MIGLFSFLFLGTNYFRFIRFRFYVSIICCINWEFNIKLKQIDPKAEMNTGSLDLQCQESSFPNKVDKISKDNPL